MRAICMSTDMSTCMPALSWCLKCGIRSSRCHCQAACRLADALPQPALLAGRVLDGLRRRSEAPDRAAVELVLRPTGVTGGDERHPGAVHLVGERLRRGAPQPRCILGLLEVVEGEGDLSSVAGAEPAAERR